MGIFLILAAGLFMASGMEVPEGDKNAPTAPTMAPAPLSFEQAYRSILDRNLKIENRRHILEATEARGLILRGAFLPSLSASATRTKSELTNADATTTSSANLSLSLNLFRGGADIAALKGVRADERKDQHWLANDTLNAEQDGLNALIAVIQKTKEAEIVDQLVKSKFEAFEIAKKRYKKGILSILEFEKASIDVDNARARMNNSFVALSSAKASLVALLGHADVRAEWPWLERLSHTQPRAISAASFPFEKRPDIQAVRALVEAENERAKQRAREMWPSVDLTLSHGIPDLEHKETSEWASTVTLTVPLFSRFLRLGTYHQQVAIRAQAETQLESARRQAVAQIETFAREFGIALESARARGRTLTITRRITEDNLQRFRLGRITVNELAIDQDRLLDSELLYSEGWAAAHLAYANLCHALGANIRVDGTCGENLAQQ